MLFKNQVSPETVPSWRFLEGTESLLVSKLSYLSGEDSCGIRNPRLRFPDQRISFGETSPKFEPWQTKGENVFL